MVKDFEEHFAGAIIYRTVDAILEIAYKQKYALKEKTEDKLIIQKKTFYGKEIEIRFIRVADDKFRMYTTSSGSARAFEKLYKSLKERN